MFLEDARRAATAAPPSGPFAAEGRKGQSVDKLEAVLRMAYLLARVIEAAVMAVKMKRARHKRTR